jgi:alpha-aminoadipate carrier protein LysW
MATCPECDADIEVDEFDVDKGDLISCPDCGANLEVTSTSPVELEASDDDDDGLRGGHDLSAVNANRIGGTGLRR